MSGFDRRSVLRLAGAVGVAGATGGATAAALAGCGTTGELAPTEPLPDSRVHVGLLVPESGGYQGIGVDIVDGFRRFLAANGNRLGGHPYMLHQEDEGASPDDALAGAERLVEQGVHALVGVTTSGALLAVSALAEERDVPLLGTHAAPQELPDSPYVWHLSHLSQEPGLALGGHLVTAVSGPVAILAADDAAGTGAVAGLRESFDAAQAADQLVDPVLTPANPEPADDFFTRSLAEVVELEPAAVFGAYAGAAAEAFVRQYLTAGLDPSRLYGPAGLTEGVLDRLAEEVGAAAVGIRTASTYAPELRVGENRSFSVDYHAEVGRMPTAYAVAGYDTASVLDKAIRLTGGSPSRRQINQMLGEVGLIDSPRGQWQFNQVRSPTQKWYLREVVPDGPVLANVVVSELGTLG